MRVLCLIVLGLALGACATDGYRQHADGYWYEPRPPQAQVGPLACDPWADPFWDLRFRHAWYPCSYAGLGTAWGAYVGYRPWYAVHHPGLWYAPVYRSRRDPRAEYELWSRQEQRDAWRYRAIENRSRSFGGEFEGTPGRGPKPAQSPGSMRFPGVDAGQDFGPRDSGKGGERDQVLRDQ